LEAGKVELAIDAYNKALSTMAADFDQQEGVLLLLRASAYLLQAEKQKEELKASVEDLQGMLPASANINVMIQQAVESGNPALSRSILQRLSMEGQGQEKQFKRTQFLHGNMQYSLLNAAQDSLRATELLPSYSTSWLRAGEILSGRSA
jgi:tetratricopeptide (TPR) repeat protein